MSLAIVVVFDLNQTKGRLCITLLCYIEGKVTVVDNYINPQIHGIHIKARFTHCPFLIIHNYYGGHVGG